MTTRARGPSDLWWLASNQVQDLEIESIIPVWVLIFAHKVTQAQLGVQCTFVMAIFKNGEPTFSYTLSPLHDINISHNFETLCLAVIFT